MLLTPLLKGLDVPTKGVGEWVVFNVSINTLQVISETSLSSQSLALVLIT